MKSYELVIRKCLSLCSINIVAWLLLWEGDVTAFSVLSSSRRSWYRRSDSDRVTLVKQPCYKCCQYPWRLTPFFKHYYFPFSRAFAIKNGLWLVPPNETSTDELEQHDIAPYKSNHIDGTNRKNGCVVELIEPETNCTVRIIGVFHGSHSSSKDVMQCVTSSTDAVVLELCSDRYRDLILEKPTNNVSMQRLSESDTSCVESDLNDEEFGVKETTTSTSMVTTQSEVGTTRSPYSSSWFEQYVRVVEDTIRRQGWRTGIVVAILGMVNGFQEQILQLQPGLEFITASEISSNYSIPIILADQDVAVTLQRIGQLPHITYDLWFNFILKRSWGTSFGPLAYALSLAVFGGWMHMDGNQAPKLLSLPQFLTRNLDAIQDFLRFVGLPLLLTQALNILISQQDSPSAIDAVVVNDLNLQQDNPVIATAINVIIIVLFYLSVALPATQVILMERDEVLSSGIRAACRVAKGTHKNMSLRKSEKNVDTHQDVEVVVVLGLLHVNGVALRLSQNRE